ncbi:16S rRNA (guanine(966)-N(2))-methyltransferase RsmD [Geitlerinema sp. PCC 9228]|jgi:16S rRNA (guanine(966)-N(2))-methyltransferase RsmD|uniref:16S rRNA (guanine(966)-N(2))-methyltransferase RsmD n=1 Tax=Geitlerinema sp. PCC 9228 TaxID=111611 RepID=UPI0008F9AA61|nr:16S rRNA (guanine(966)-N(2))-methyltransferase RsmD [Geitlerinema sp. PCC 9228]
MRIYGNRKLKTIPGQQVRPTAAKVREAVFNIWQDRVVGCCWLDLCAGNGSMGAEALCRGARWVVGIEKWGKACQTVKQNWQQVAPAGSQFEVIRGNVVAKLPQLAGTSFDLIYFDPPYRENLYQPVLQAIATHHLLAAGGELAVESDGELSFGGWLPETLAVCRQRVYGDTTVSFFQPVAMGKEA